MNAQSAQLVFRSDTTVFNWFLVKLCAVFSVILFLATVVGQIRGNRFPAYFDLIVASLIPWAFFLFLVLVIYIAAAYFKISVSPTHLRCYNTFGKYQSVSWLEIRDAETRSMSGIPYIFIYVGRLSQPLTLPVWLRNMQQFRDHVENYAGPNHPLTKVLYAVVA